MSYVHDLIQGNFKSLKDLLKQSLSDGSVNESDLGLALKREAEPVPEGGDIYSLSLESQKVLGHISLSVDRDVLIIVKKILRSTKYAAITWYAVSGHDNNPHHLPVKRLDLEGSI